MKEKLAKKLKAEKVVRILTIVMAVLFGMMPICMSVLFNDDTQSALFGVMFLFEFLFITIGIVYIAAFLPLKRSVTNLKKRDAIDVLDDAYPNEPTLPNSKIYCGKRAMIVGKPYSIFLYDDVAWVFMRVTKAYGVLTISKSVCICTKTGKTIEIKADKDEINWLVSNVLVHANPQLLVGYGPQQVKAYKQIKKDYKNSLK